MSAIEDVMQAIMDHQVRESIRVMAVGGYRAHRLGKGAYGFACGSKPYRQRERGLIEAGRDVKPCVGCWPEFARAGRLK